MRNPKRKFKTKIKLKLSHVTVLELLKALKKFENQKPTDMYARVVLKQCRYIIDGYYKDVKRTDVLHYGDVPDSEFIAAGGINIFKDDKGGVNSEQ